MRVNINLVYVLLRQLSLLYLSAARPLRRSLKRGLICKIQEGLSAPGWEGIPGRGDSKKKVVELRVGEGHVILFIAPAAIGTSEMLTGTEVDRQESGRLNSTEIILKTADHLSGDFRRR